MAYSKQVDLLEPIDMAEHLDKIELYLIRVLKTLITERSVSRAAMRLQSTQPAVSAQLKKLRTLTGDPLLVRSGNSMAPTDTALRLLEPDEAGQQPGAAEVQGQRPADEDLAEAGRHAAGLQFQTSRGV